MNVSHMIVKRMGGCWFGDHGVIPTPIKYIGAKFTIVRDAPHLAGGFSVEIPGAPQGAWRAVKFEIGRISSIDIPLPKRRRAASDMSPPSQIDSQLFPRRGVGQKSQERM